MVPKSYQIRGTSGTGKTHLTRELMAYADAEPIQWNDTGRKVLIHQGEFLGVPFYFLGDYSKTCGGCDTIPSVKIVAQLLRDIAGNPDTYPPGVTVFEGLMISHMLGTVGAEQKALGQAYNWLAFLDTPLNVCLDRVVQRRQERARETGRTIKPFNPSNTQKDWPRVHQSRYNADMQGFTTTTIRHTNAVTDAVVQLEELINV